LAPGYAGPLRITLLDHPKKYNFSELLRMEKGFQMGARLTLKIDFLYQKQTWLQF
jgi:hypothetical protein